MKDRDITGLWWRVLLALEVVSVSRIEAMQTSAPRVYSFPTPKSIAIGYTVPVIGDLGVQFTVPAEKELHAMEQLMFGQRMDTLAEVLCGYHGYNIERYAGVNGEVWRAFGEDYKRCPEDARSWPSWGGGAIQTPVYRLGPAAPLHIAIYFLSLGSSNMRSYMMVHFRDQFHQTPNE